MCTNDQTHAGHPSEKRLQSSNCWACDRSHADIVSHCCRASMTDSRPAATYNDEDAERRHDWRCDKCGRPCVDVWRDMGCEAFMALYCPRNSAWSEKYLAACRFCGDVVIPKSESCPECGATPYDELLGLVALLMSCFRDDPILLLDPKEDQERIYMALAREGDREYKRKDVEWALSVLRQYNANGGGSYRTLIYSYYGFGADSYSAIYLSGGMDITNALPLEVLA